MKNKNVVVAVCIVVFISLLCFTYVFAGKRNVENLMWEYLDVKGYTHSEIQSMDVSHSFLNILLSYNEWSIAVVYTDEPTSVYYYTVKDGSIAKSGVSGSTDKENLKH